MCLPTGCTVFRRVRERNGSWEGLGRASAHAWGAGVLRVCGGVDSACVGEGAEWGGMCVWGCVFVVGVWVGVCGERVCVTEMLAVKSLPLYGFKYVNWLKSFNNSGGMRTVKHQKSYVVHKMKSIVWFWTFWAHLTFGLCKLLKVHKTFCTLRVIFEYIS